MPILITCFIHSGSMLRERAYRKSVQRLQGLQGLIKVGGRKKKQWRSDTTAGCVEETEESVAAGHMMLASWPKGLWAVLLSGASYIYIC